jgi:hypothetical protein
MAFETPFLAENQVDGLEQFGFYKIQRHTKSVIISMLQNFFSSMNTMYKIQMPDIVPLQSNYDIMRISENPENIKLFIERDFPYGQRKLPAIFVSVTNASEKKMYIGADNFLEWRMVETSSGRQTAVAIYHGAAEITLGLSVLAQDPEERMRIVEMINMCFTHYYRWQYYYTLGDGTAYTIVPNILPLEFGNENEITNESMMAIIYITAVSMKCFIEYTFRDLNLTPTMQDYVIDADSGVVAP